MNLGDSISYLRAGSFAAAFSLLLGCAGVVYKDSAGAFAVAGQLAAQRLAESASALHKARDNAYKQQIAADSKCPVAEERIFLRKASADQKATMSAAMTRYPAVHASAACAVLRACEAGQATPECTSICYSVPEAGCLVNLETSYAVDVSSLAATGALSGDALKAEVKSFVGLLETIEYRRSGRIESLLISSSLKGLSEYLGLLVKLSEARESGIASEAERLSSSLEKVRTTLEDLTKVKLSDASSKDFAKVRSSISAIGNLAEGLSEIAQNHADAKKIRAIVSAQSATVHDLVGSLQSVALGDDLLSAAIMNNSNRRIRQDLEAQFSQAASQIERLEILNQIEAHPYETVATGDELKDVFTATLEAHDDLVKLLNDPTDAQKKAIAAESLSNFKTVVLGFANVLKIFI